MAVKAFEVVPMSLRLPLGLKEWLEQEAEKEISSVNRMIWVILQRERERREDTEN